MRVCSQLAAYSCYIDDIQLMSYSTGLFSLISLQKSDEALNNGQQIFALQLAELEAIGLTKETYTQLTVDCSLSEEFFHLLTIQIIAPNIPPAFESILSELVRGWKTKKRADGCFSFTSIPLEIRIAQGNQLLDTYKPIYIQAKYYFEKNRVIENFDPKALQNDIQELLLRPLSLSPVLLSKEISHDEKILLLRQELLYATKDSLQKNSSDIFEEYHRLILSLEKEFIRLRSIPHLLKIIQTHFILRKTAKQSSRNSFSSERTVHTKIFPSTIFYAFGEREVLSIIITLSYLDDYERLTANHIVEAVRQSIQDISLLPESSYHYFYRQEKMYTLYLEIEKKDTTPFSEEEINLLQDTLSHLTHKAIEPVMSLIDIPVNEEENLRNILLLSQELKTRKDKPQVILQFIKQHKEILEFSITIMRVGDKNEQGDMKKIDWPEKTPYLQIVPISSAIIGYLRGKYPKELISSTAYCSRKPFLRPNKTIDYVRSREFIITSLEQIFGPMRDVNGGLIGKQKRFLDEVQEKMRAHERHDIEYLEAIFCNMTPVSVRSLFSPDSVLAIYRLVKKTSYIHHGKCIQLSMDHLSEESLGDLYDFSCFLFSASKKIDERSLLQGIIHSTKLDSWGHDIAYTYYSSASNLVFHLLLIRKNCFQNLPSIEQHIEKIVEKHDAVPLAQKSITICLPRPTLLLDPRIGTDRTSGIVIKMLYDGLMRLDSKGKPTAALAKDISISENKRKYTFSLRESFWSNNQPVTAYDFEYAWKKILDPSFKTLFDYLFNPIKNARAVKAGLLPIDSLGVHAVDNTTLVVDLEIPAPYFLELLCHWIYSPLSKTVDLTDPGWAYYAEESYVCNGPFRLTKWRQETEIQVVKNELYWDKDAVHLDKIHISIIEDSAQALQLYQKGHLDWIGEPLTEIPIDYQRAHPNALLSHPISSIQWFAFNVQQKPFQSKKIRQAFHCALDKKEIISHTLFGDETPSESIVPKSLSNIEQTASTCQRTLAKKLFQEGLQELELSVSQIPTLTLKVYNQEPMKSVALHAIAQWQEIFGITINAEILPWHRYFESIPEFRYDIISIMWYSWFFDPMYTFETLSSLSNGMNLSQWQNPAFISLFRKAQQETSPARRQEYLKKLEEIVMEEVPIVPVFEYTLRYMKNKRLSNIYLSHLGNIDFKWAEIIF